jgi:hypothetical protein
MKQTPLSNTRSRTATAPAARHTCTSLTSRSPEVACACWRPSLPHPPSQYRQTYTHSPPSPPSLQLPNPPRTHATLHASPLLPSMPSTPVPTLSVCTPRTLGSILCFTHTERAMPTSCLRPTCTKESWLGWSSSAVGTQSGRPDEHMRKHAVLCRTPQTLGNQSDVALQACIMHQCSSRYPAASDPSKYLHCPPATSSMSSSRGPTGVMVSPLIVLSTARSHASAASALLPSTTLLALRGTTSCLGRGARRNGREKG